MSDCLRVWTLKERARAWMRVVCFCEGIDFYEYPRLEREHVIFGFERRAREKGSQIAIAYVFEKVRKWVEFNQNHIHWHRLVKHPEGTPQE